MRLEASLEGGKVSSAMAQLATGMKRAADIAAKRTAIATIAQARLAIAPALGVRAARTFGLIEEYPHPTKGLAELVGSRWFKNREDILAGLARDNTIEPRRKRALAIPLDVVASQYHVAAGALPNINQSGKRRTTPAIFELKTGRKLHQVRGRDGRIFLVVDLPAAPRGLVSATSKKSPSLVGGRAGGGLIGRARATGITPRPAKVSVPVFVLSTRAHVPQQYEYEPVREFWQPYLEDAFFQELVSLGLLD